MYRWLFDSDYETNVSDKQQAHYSSEDNVEWDVWSHLKIQWRVVPYNLSSMYSQQLITDNNIRYGLTNLSDTFPLDGSYQSVEWEIVSFDGAVPVVAVSKFTIHSVDSLTLPLPFAGKNLFAYPQEWFMVLIKDPSKATVRRFENNVRVSYDKRFFYVESFVCDSSIPTRDCFNRRNDYRLLNNWAYINTYGDTYYFASWRQQLWYFFNDDLFGYMMTNMTDQYFIDAPFEFIFLSARFFWYHFASHFSLLCADGTWSFLQPSVIDIAKHSSSYQLVIEGKVASSKKTCRVDAFIDASRQTIRFVRDRTYQPLVSDISWTQTGIDVPQRSVVSEKSSQATVSKSFPSQQENISVSTKSPFEWEIPLLFDSAYWFSLLFPHRKIVYRTNFVKENFGLEWFQCRIKVSVADLIYRSRIDENGSLMRKLAAFDVFVCENTGKISLKQEVFNDLLVRQVSDTDIFIFKIYDNNWREFVSYIDIKLK